MKPDELAYVDTHLPKIFEILQPFVTWKASAYNLVESIKVLADEINDLNIVIANLNKELELLEDQVEMYREEEQYL